jgi:hypothetical protein
VRRWVVVCGGVLCRDKQEAWWLRRQSTSESRSLAGTSLLRPMNKTLPMFCGPSSSAAAPPPIGVQIFRLTKTTTSPLRHSAIEGSPPPIRHPITPSNPRNHVCAVPRPFHQQAPMAPEVDEAARQLVLQRRRIQAARIEVRSPRTRRIGWRNWEKK